MTIHEILTRVGSRAQLARQIGVSPQAMQGWVTSGQVPPKRAVQIEEATAGLIKRHELRPDLWTPPVLEAVDGD